MDVVKGDTRIVLPRIIDQARLGFLLKEISGSTLLLVDRFGIRTKELLDALRKLLPGKASVKNKRNRRIRK
jgi:hypothetical protein